MGDVTRNFLEICLDSEGELVDEVRQEHESQNSLLEDVLLDVDEPQVPSRASRI